MRTIKYGVIHCAQTCEQDITAEDVDRWHKENGWSGIGYHYFVRRDGLVEKGRDEEKIGTHVKGHNSDSIGICYAGGVDKKGKESDNKTDKQSFSMILLVHYLKSKYPGIQILGHRDFQGVKKFCPSFDVTEWLQEKY